MNNEQKIIQMTEGPKPLSTAEMQEFQGAIGKIFHRLGLGVNTPGTEDTPRRWLDAMTELTTGYQPDPKIRTAFPAECVECKEHELEHLVNGPISFSALCEHHVLPFTGQIHIGVVRSSKHGEVLGLSKFTRIVRQYTRRFTLQERIQQEIASHVMASIAPVGVAVAITSDHSCISSRGVREHGTHTNSLLWRGIYDKLDEGPAFRQDFLQMIKMQPR